MRQHRSGIAAIYFVLIMVVLAAFISFATDYAHVQMAKSQLETATDAACRYSAKYMAQGQSTVFAKASAVAAENTVNGAPLALLTNDVQVGRWDSSAKTFTNNGSPANAVQVRGKLLASR